MLLTLLHQWESITSRKRKRSTMTTTSSSSTMPLSGASILIVSDDVRRETELSTFVTALGGRIVSSVVLAQVVLWSCDDVVSQEGDTSTEQRRILDEALNREIPVVDTKWLERASGLNEQEHWSDINVDSHVPAIVALLGEREQQQNHTNSRYNLRDRNNTGRRDAPNQLGKSISETFNDLTHENPDQMEEEAIRRAMELSMLDVAIVDYQESSGGDLILGKNKKTSSERGKQPHEILQVGEDASPAEIKSAYRKLARKHHPDKGGDSNVFEAIARAYRTMLSLDVEIERERTTDTNLKGTAHWDNELQDHRRLVTDLFQAHGGNLDESIAKQDEALKKLGLVAQDAGATNRNERNEQIRNSCFYLSLAASYLSGIGALIDDEEADRALIGETALQLKRAIESAVVAAHPEWAVQGMVGEEVQAFSDFLTYSLDGNTVLSDWAVVIFDASSGFCDVFKGCQYGKLADADEEWARSNTITLLYIPGHYQPLMLQSPTLTRPTLNQVLSELDAAGVVYVVTDGS